MKSTKIAVLLAAAGLSASAFATNGYFSHGYGMKAKGMAGVGIALPQDALAAATNPAGMVLVGDRMDVGLDWFRPIRGAAISGNGGPGVDGDFDGSDKKNFFIPEFGYTKMLNPSMSFGVSVYGNGGMNTDYKDGINFFNGGNAARTGVDLMQLFISPTIAYKLTKDHAVGVSLNLAYQRFKAYGLNGFGLADAGYDSSRGWGIKLGYTGNLTDTVSVGATYQSETRMSKLDKYKGLFAEQGDFDIPETYGIGIAVKATPSLTVAADVQKINYSKVRSVANNFDATCFLAGTCPLGADNGPGFGWGDATIYKIGASYAYSKDLTLRAGYSTTDQPIPSNQTLFNILAPAVVENHLTLGATWNMSPTTELTVGYMHAFKRTINGSGSIGLGLGGGEANLRMHEDSLGIAYGIKFQ